MDYWNLTAAGLSLVLVGAHVIGGGKDVHEPMLGSDMGKVLKAYTSILWHAVTVVLIIGTLALLGAAMGEAKFAWVIVAQYLGFAGLFLFYGIVRLKSIWIMPQWIAFILIAALAGIGAGSGI